MPEPAPAEEEALPDEVLAKLEARLALQARIEGLVARYRGSGGVP